MTRLTETNSGRYTGAGEMSILQVFNRYMDRGGEEEAVERIGFSLQSEARIGMLDFQSKDWTGAGAPAFWRQALWVWRNPASVQRLNEYLASEPPDVFLFHNVFPVGSAALYREAYRVGIPAVQFVHNFRPFSVNGYLWAADRIQTAGLRKNFLPEIVAGSWQNSRLKTGWYAGIIWMMHAQGYWRNITAWIANSEFMRATFIEAGVPSDRIFTVRYCREIRPEEPAEEPRSGYVFLGRLISAKGIQFLVHTWEQLRAQLGDRCPRLEIAGEGPLETWVRERASANPAITFRGFLKGMDKSRLISQSKAVIVPSLWWEPLGLVVYDAYEHATPVLAARSGGLTETVIPGETGLLHAPGNAGELIRNVMMFEADATMSARMGRQGRRWLLASANQDDWRRKMMAVFEYALRQKSLQQVAKGSRKQR